MIRAYLAGEGSYAELCVRYNIPSFDTVRKWVLQYNDRRTIRGSKTGGTTNMTKGRKTTYEERIEIVSFCIENHKDCQLAADTYQVSYQQVYSWVRKYEAQGVESLTDKRGRTKPEAEMTELEKLRAENKLLKAQNKRQEMEMAFLKTRRDRKEAVLSQIQNETICLAIQETHDETGCSIPELCVFAGIPRSSYYKWLNRKESKNEQFNSQLLPLIKEAYEEKNGILGYRQMTIKLNRENDFHVNQKRIYRLMQILGLKSVCRRKRKNYIKSTPQVIAENVLNREFTAENFGEKWLTDATEMKYGVSSKAYLSAILDLGDKSIVSFVIGHSNNNALVFETFDIAHEQHPDAKPIFHSDRGYQYTSKAFKKKLDDPEYVQSVPLY